MGLTLLPSRLSLTSPAFTSIVSAVFLCMIGLAVTNPPAPVHAVKQTEFTTAWGAITDMVIAYAGHVAFFGFIAEMKEPKDFPKSLCVLQTVEIALYVAVAVVIYCYAGDSVTSPALGSMGPVLRKVAYGLALPSVGFRNTVGCDSQANVGRLSSRESSSATLPASRYTCASGPAVTASTSAMQQRWGRGVRLG